ncbi:D-isomer specific 2-hydroxyacid dehydrogenase [Lentinula boryana]|uniref:D-isomer specific 2-hydroxyacid dehydrogenase n=1 Tax=Lentinula boryana TaxID=40481 RepID=A0ABQ8QVK4_9AGAR|nr:D-isomer specific 2-hydroxyacid dehydrogenase [Lentinula boryana]
MVILSQSSAAGVLALLSEPDPVFKQHALKSLNALVPRFWAEISEHIALIESLYDNDDMPKDARDSAALLASKVYYFLGEYVESLSFALGAGNAFEAESRVPGSEEYVETVMSMAIDKYVEEQTNGKQDKVDPRLQRIIESIFTRCISEGEYKQAVGIALESHRLDIISKIYEQVKDTSILTYAMEAVIDSGFSLSYRDTVLRFIYPLFPRPTAGDGSSLAQSLTRLLVTLGDSSLTVPLLVSLVPKEYLLAYQFSFDLVEGGARDYLDLVGAQLPAGNADNQEIFDKIRSILTGQESVKLYLEFLKRNNHVDTLILKHTKDSLEPRSSIYHTALTLQNAFMHSGTTSDLFLRENLEWLGLASNWSKFSATAGLGVIHKGYYEQGKTILGPYLPQNGNESSIPGAAYSEGGALYALGLINAGCGTEISGYLREALRTAQGEVVQHGAALGLGIAAMGSKNMETFEDLKNVLFMDSAVAGEASGYAMGLIMLGTAAEEPVREMLSYARETQHEKIIRGLAIGIAFVFYGRQEEADETVKELLAETDPILRYGGVYTLALAYAGTSNNDAVRQLLHIAVSDVSDDVRRAAVTSLAFLLFKNPSQVPRIVQLLSESYNPHVRCGATLALGIACAGTGMQDAIEILEPMTKDSVDFVRQGAFIALGMILLEQSEASSPSLASTRALYSRIIADKHEDPMAKLGAALGQGLIDAGGRNVTINLQSRAGSRNTNAIVGMVLFCQFWYWYPLAHCACLAFEPTGIIGLDGDLKVPKFEFTSNAKPSLFAYPPTTPPPKKETVTKVATAVLSTTAKVKAREKKKAATEGDAMETDEKPDTKTEGDGDVEMKAEGTSKASTSKAAKKEPSFETLPNLSRVTPAQLAYISFSSDGKYQPVRVVTAKPASTRAGKNVKQVEEKVAGGGGILILVDRRPEQQAEFIQFETVIQPPPAEPCPRGGCSIVFRDDYQQVALTTADWSSIADQIQADVFTDTLSDEDSLAKRLEPYEIICAMRERTKFLPLLLDRLPNLRLIATTGRVNRSIDVNYARKKGIYVSGTDNGGNSTVEHIWTLIMSVARHIVVEHINIRTSNPRWQTVVPMGLAGSTLGLIGVGRLGSETAKIAKVFGMKVIGWSPHLTPERAEAQGVEFIASKQELLSRSDIVSLHLVLSESTTKIINAADLDLMKASSFLINTSRGPLIDEAALVEALKNKKIAGAGLDVFEQEPLPLDHPLRFLDNVTLSPHNGYVNETNYKVFWTSTVENIKGYLDGKPRSLLE